MFEENTNTKGFLLGFITGSVIGSLAALLYAPKTGKELRQDISLKKDILMEDTGRIIETAKTKASDLISEGRKAAVNFLDETKVQGDIAMQTGEKTLNQGKDKITEELNRIKDSGKSGGSSYSDERNKSKL